MPLPLTGHFNDLFEFVQIDARILIVSHVIKNTSETGEGASPVGMPLATRIDDGREGTDIGGLTLRGW